jgi:hypothetical protein
MDGGEDDNHGCGCDERASKLPNTVIRYLYGREDLRNGSEMNLGFDSVKMVKKESEGVRLYRYLLYNTSMQVCISQALPRWFDEKVLRT